MKFSILALGAAVAGITSHCAAQLQIEPAFPRAEARLVSQNQDYFGTANSPQPDPPTDDASGYYAETAPQAEITQQPTTDTFSNNDVQSVLEKPVSTNKPVIESPAGQPVVKKQVTVGAPLEVLAMTPEVGMVPICWQGTSGCPTPNPVANYMTMGGCTNGLWDNYACQRARQCAVIQQQIYGHNRYTCNSCGVGGRTGAVAGSCASGQCGTGFTGVAASQCAVNGTAAATHAACGLVQNYAPQSPLLGDMQAGLPAVDMSNFNVPAPYGYATTQGQGQSIQLTNTPSTGRLPSGQPMLQLPNDVPSIPQGSPAPADTMPLLPAVMPPLSIPASTPVVASRQSASLR